MRRLYLALGLALALTGIAWAQFTQPVPNPASQPITGTVTATQGTAGNLNATVVGTGTFATQSSVTQGTAANLNATVVGTGTFATQSTLSAETTKVIGTVNISAGQSVAVTNTGTFATQSTVTNAGTFAVQSGGATSGGNTVYFVQPTASDNHVVIKNGAGQVYKVTVTNNSATVNYLRLYNAGTGFNGCNSATNIVYQVAIPASTTVGGISDAWPVGMAFSTGISICVTSGYATTDTTNATASAMSVNIGYN